MAVTMQVTDEEDFSANKVIFYVALLCCIAGTTINLLAEVSEARARGLWKYITSFENCVQLVMIAFNIVIVLTSLILSNFIAVAPHVKDKYSPTELLRVFMVLGLLFNTIELFVRIRVFDFFAYFVRQMSEIVEDAAPLGAMLGCIVLTQAVLFWVLDQNSDEAEYDGLSGFGNCLINSYRLALGDFEIVSDN